MTAAEWDDLARLADTYPPSERTWHVHEMHKVFVGSGDPRSLSTIVHMSGDDLADLTEEGAREVRRDAAWIAAANPATILRLIEDRGALAARLAAVEALADEWERRAQLAESTADARTGLSDEVSLRQHAVVMSNRAEDLRAVLSAAPTDTTKET